MSLINREDLIAEYDRVHVGAPGGARKLMVDAPEAKQEQQWIPCSERLPERRKHYIVTDFGSVEEAYYNCDEHWFSVDGNKLKDVTAWMPLPKPYDGGTG
ncbi:MAG: DUF551 domain-containing protein [Lachnospiraceae bacterium]|nr:DUF551 domain-containing protein [Lachnospiraceae bacterium]